MSKKQKQKKKTLQRVVKRAKEKRPEIIVSLVASVSLYTHWTIKTNQSQKSVFACIVAVAVKPVKNYKISKFPVAVKTTIGKRRKNQTFATLGELTRTQFRNRNR